MLQTKQIRIILLIAILLFVEGCFLKSKNSEIIAIQYYHSNNPIENDNLDFIELVDIAKFSRIFNSSAATKLSFTKGGKTYFSIKYKNGDEILIQVSKSLNYDYKILLRNEEWVIEQFEFNNMSDVDKWKDMLDSLDEEYELNN